MKIQSILLAAVAAVTLAAPAAAFAASWHGSGDERGYGQDQGYGHFQAYGNGYGGRDHDGWRRSHCRRGVFYTRGNACSNDYGRDRDSWRGHDHHSHDDGSDHRRWR